MNETSSAPSRAADETIVGAAGTPHVVAATAELAAPAPATFTAFN